MVNNQPNVFSVSHLIEMLNQYKYQEIIETNVSDNKLPIRLIQSMAALHEGNERKWYAEWLTIRQIHQENRAPIFTTLTEEEPFDLKRIKNMGILTQEGTMRFNKYLELVTIGDQTVAFKLPITNPLKVTTVHLWLSFPSNVNENFYVFINGNDRSESFRFSNNYIATCDDGMVTASSMTKPHLFTLVISEKDIKVFIDGVLRRRQLRKEAMVVSDVVVKLLGTPGADLSGVVHGIEIWSSELTFEGFETDSELMVQQHVVEKLQSGDINNLYNLLQSVSGLDIEPYAEEVFVALSEELHKEGHREWIFEDLLGRLPQEKSERWKVLNASLVPQPILSVTDLKVKFYKEPNKRFNALSAFRNQNKASFYAVDTVNFNVYPGDIIGIIGANGAGKSTLLKTVAGLVPIEKGRILLKGKHLLVSPGLGVRIELTGRQNIYLAGCFMGLSKRQIDLIIDEIIEFSELGEAIDRPFKFYSDGMKSRLVFSLVTSVAPEILMLDELLSAGDIKFQKKAIKRMDELIERARAVVIVTHSVSFVAQKCNKALLLVKGKQHYYGDPQIAVSHYLNELHISSDDVNEEPEFNMSIMQQINNSSDFGMGG